MVSSNKISVVTVSYNMERYIEQTIRSVVNQDYSNIEYIVVDGASTDRTVEIARRYEEKISTLISEPDDSHFDAMQKGLNIATGDVLAWLNADDVYYPWTLSIVGEIFEKFPDVDWIMGLPSHINETGQCIRMSNIAQGCPRHYVCNGWFRQDLGGYLQQESMFWRRSLWDKVGGFDLSLKLAAEYKLFTQFAQHSDLVSVAVPLAAFRRRHGEQKSSAQKNAYLEEVKRICLDQNLKAPPLLWRAVARRSLSLRMLCRLLIWKKCQIIAYSTTKHEWELKTLRRPIARESFSGLLLDNAVK